VGLGKFCGIWVMGAQALNIAAIAKMYVDVRVRLKLERPMKLLFCRKIINLPPLIL
jgi:hypothetical protein